MEMTWDKEKRIAVSEEIDSIKAAMEARALAETAGFGETEQYMIATAVSELAANSFRHAMKGVVTIKILDRKTQKGIEVVVEDQGPGIEDIGKAVEDHFSTSGGLGLGLPGVKRLMNEFTIDTERVRGTKITARKWVYKNVR